MAYDFQLDPQTNDWNFDSLRDVSGVTGAELVNQRIRVRLKIQRGSYLFDRAGTLGSNLYSTFAKSIPKGKQSIELFIREALQPMDDIIVDQILVLDYRDDPNINMGEVRSVIYWHAVPMDDLLDDTAGATGSSTSIVFSLT